MCKQTNSHRCIVGYKGEEDEARHPLVIGVGEERKAYVREDKVLGKEIEEFEDFFSSPPGLR